MNENKEQSNSNGSESLRELRKRWKDGTFQEIVDDWKWIFTYSRRYKGAIVFYIFLGVLSTTLGLVGAVASKHVIDIITGYQTSKLAILIIIYVGSTLFGLVLNSVLGRIATDGTVRNSNNSVIGYAKGIPTKYAALYFFFRVF